MSAYEGATFSGFVSSYTSLIPFTPDVEENVSYSITLNPDLLSITPPPFAYGLSGMDPGIFFTDLTLSGADHSKPWKMIPR